MDQAAKEPHEYQRQFTPSALFKSKQPQQHRLNHPVVKQLDLNNSRVVSDAEKESTTCSVGAAKEPKMAIKSVSTQTKCLCGIIISLILIILALIVFDRRHYDKSIRQLQEQNMMLERTLLGQQQSSLSPSSASRAEQLRGRLLTLNADNHYLAVQVPPSTGSSDPSDDFADEFPNSNEDDEDKNPDTSHNELPLAGKPNRFSGGKHRDTESICMSPGCIKAAAQILENMDNKTKPCEDFYRFACGRWIDAQEIPDEMTSLSVFSVMSGDMNSKLRKLIERKPTSEDPPIVGQLRNMYQSCMNVTEIEAQAEEPLLEVLRFFGGWPVLQRPEESRPSASRRSLTLVTSNHQDFKQFSWLDTLIKFRARGFSHDMIIDLSIVPDVKDSRRYIIELDQSSLGLPDMSYYFKGLNDTTVAAYLNLMVESAVMLGASRPEARKQLSEVLELETQLARISIPREQRRNVTRLYNKMPARDLYKLAPNIDWERYLKGLIQDQDLDLDKDEVNVKVPSFIRALDGLLARTDPRTLSNYMLWRVVRNSLSGLSRRWRELLHGYQKVITGKVSEEVRWEQCINSLEGTLGTALSALYVKNYFNKNSKVTAMEMVDYIRNEFLKIIDEVDWMDEETRDEAKLKARGITPYIGYPDELLQDHMIEEFYAGLEMSPFNYYQNIRNLRIWSTNYAFSQLRKPNKRGNWKKHARAAVVNAYYNSLENSIEFPAGILQGAFFDSERPNYMNFGAIGYIIGHEITHGFDDRGRQFDLDGNDRNWWKPKTDARFKERAQCIVEQYGNYTVKENGLRINGVNTQGENIADNGGIKEAFRAYRRWTKDHGREKRLPGLAYSPDQLFWISAANIWCAKSRPEALKLRINSGVHSPAQFRIIGPLSNSVEFARSFNCPLGSPMNPRKKCSVW